MTLAQAAFGCRPCQRTTFNWCHHEPVPAAPHGSRKLDPTNRCPWTASEYERRRQEPACFAWEVHHGE